MKIILKKTRPRGAANLGHKIFFIEITQKLWLYKKLTGHGEELNQPSRSAH
jgi:hypothetical protein